MLFVLGVVIIIGSRLVPIYGNYFIISKIANEAQLLITENNVSRYEAREFISSQFQANNLWGVDVQRRIGISKTNKGLAVRINYEVRTNLIANIDVVIHFDKDYGPS